MRTHNHEQGVHWTRFLVLAVLLFAGSLAPAVHALEVQIEHHAGPESDLEHHECSGCLQLAPVALLPNGFEAPTPPRPLHVGLLTAPNAPIEGITSAAPLPRGPPTFR